jgi:Zn-dependent protease
MGPVPRARRAWTLFGIPIRINTSWFFVVAFVAWSLSSGYFPARCPGFGVGVYWAMGWVAALLLFACILLHELGHSLVARQYGIPVTCVTLFIFGGVAQLSSGPTRPSIELRVALAGPLVSALIAGACCELSAAIPIASPLHQVTVTIMRYLAVINAGIVVFNLLPGFPLDGGRVLRAVLWAWFDSSRANRSRGERLAHHSPERSRRMWTGGLRKATRIASLIGSAFGVGLLALGAWVMVRGAWVGGLWYIFLGFFLRGAALTSYRQASSAQG